MLKCLVPLKNNLRDRASQRLIDLLLVLGPSLAFAPDQGCRHSVRSR